MIKRCLVLLLLLSAPAWALPVRTGTPTQNVMTTANSGSFSVTVPADAELMICALSGYTGTVGAYSAGSTFTVGGQTMTVVTGGDSNSGWWMSTMWYRVSPPTGAQTVAWDWSGTAASTNQSSFYCAWYKTLNTSAPVRASSCVQAGSAAKTTASLTALSNDLIVAIGTQYANAAQLTFTWTGATQVQAFTPTGGELGDVSLAEAAPTGNQTVSFSATPDNDGAICAVTVAGTGAAAPLKKKPPILY